MKDETVSMDAIIADRAYPLKVTKGDEEKVKNAVQLVNDTLPTPIIDEYNRRKRNGFASNYLDFEDCQKFLVSLLDLYPQTTVVLDGPQ